MKLFEKTKRCCFLLFMGAVQIEEKGPIVNSEL